MSLKTIAQMVGASPSTVSRVLNGGQDGCASPELRERIFRAAHEISYVPNTAARRLKKGEQAEAARPRVLVTLARIRSLSDDPFFLELFQAIQEELYQQGCLMEDIHRLNERPDLAIPRADGIIILGRCTEQSLARMKAANRNVVGIWRNPLNFEVDEVVCDGKKAATLAVEHLLALGHRQIGYIGDCSFESRYVGYCETLIHNNLPMHYRFIIETDQTELSGYEAMNRLLQEGGVTAVLCANDISAVGAQKALARRGARKIALIAIDDIDEAQKALLTTVAIPRRDMARMAVLLLLDRIRKGHQERVRVELPCRVVVRGSDTP